MTEDTVQLTTSELEPCVYCPHLCRHVCPSAVGSDREAATPAAMATGVWAWLQGRADASWAAAHASLCVDCGRCTDHCKHSRPLGKLLAAARSSTAPPPYVEPPGRVHGTGELVAVQTDARQWAGALSTVLGQPVARYAAPDHLGAPLLDHPTRFQRYARALRDRLAGRVLVVADASSARAAEAAELQFKMLEDLVSLSMGGTVIPACTGTGMLSDAAPGCCGARRHLRDAHPEVALDMAQDLITRMGPGPLACQDAACAAWLREQGADVVDPIDSLLKAAASLETP